MRSIRGRRKERGKEAAVILPAKVMRRPSHIRCYHSTAAKKVFLSIVQGDDFKFSCEVDGHVLGEARDSMFNILTEKV